MPDISKLLTPQSIAVIGASANTQKVGGIVLQNLVASYKGQILPINPKEDTIQGLTCYKNFSSLPQIPDLTIIAIPADKALSLLPEIGEKGGKNLLIFSAGFKEVGESGKELEQQLISLTQKYQFNILGPNCLGFINNSAGLNATFGNAPTKMGNLKVLSQSGAIATSFFDWSVSHTIGIDTFVTLGNKSVLNENHFLEHFKNNQTSYQEPGLSNLQPIGLYLESISSGQELITLAKQITKTQPVFLLKPGKTKAAASAMQSHTGSIAGSNEVLSAALKESGIIRADTLEDFFNLAKALSWENAPEGNKVAVISNAGGPGVISADAIASSALELASISESAEKILAEKLPRMAGLHNPVDVLGDALADRFQYALEVLLAEEGVNAVIVVLTPQLMTEIEKTAQIISQNAAKQQKPIYCSFMGGTQVAKGESVLNQAKIPNFSYPEAAIRTLELVWNLQKWKQYQEENVETIKYKLPSDTSSLLQTTEADYPVVNINNSSQILNYLQIPTPKSVVTTNLQDAEEFVNQVDWPVVLKNASPKLLHKSDSGGVKKDLFTFQQLRSAWLSIQNGQEQIPVQVQQQLENYLEIIVGYRRDDQFGNYLVLGLGGKLANLHKDANICLFPITSEKIMKTFSQSKYSLLFTGYRDIPPVNISEFTKHLAVLGQFFEENTKIKEMEINPVIVNRQGHSFADTKIILA